MMSAAALTVIFGLCVSAAASYKVDSLISRASALVQAQQNKPADEVRVLDHQLGSLAAEAVKLGYTAAAPLAQAAADPKRPVKLRLWLIIYLQSLEDPGAFPLLKRLLLDPGQPDILRGAAARAVAAAPVSARTKRRALCAALDAKPERETLLETLFSLARLGCEDPAGLELWAFETRLRPEGDEEKRVMLAIAALGRTPTLTALDSLDRLFAHFITGSDQRRLILEALLPRASQMSLNRRSWSDRASGMLARESAAPASARAALRLIAALGDPRSADAVARLLKSRDGGVVVAAAEALASVKARDRREAVKRIHDGFLKDARFEAGPDRDPVDWYERLGAALKALQ